jgi:hypothetical protein
MMLNGNLYGLIITMLTFVITVILTMRQVEQTGVHVEFTISPVIMQKQQPEPRPAIRPSPPEPRGGIAGAQSARKPNERLVP